MCPYVHFDFKMTIIENNETSGYQESMTDFTWLLPYLSRQGLAGQNQECPIPCRTKRYEHEFIPILPMDEDVFGGRVMYVAFSQPYDTFYKEYLLYDFGKITAAVGGAVGLFLGVSVISCFSTAIDWFNEKVKSSRKSLKDTPTPASDLAKTLKVKPLTYESNGKISSPFSVKHY